MTMYDQMPESALRATMSELKREYADFVAKGLSLNMARGKPSSEQLDLSMPMLDILCSDSSLESEEGVDCRNYGIGIGLPEARRLMAEMLDDSPSNTIVGGNSSLNLMYDAISRYWIFGALGSTPWGNLPHVRWICPVPGYDRHFAVTEAFGIEMIPVAMTADGPDMDEVERIAREDSSVKGIWCVPKYSNPGGVTYSDETVRRLAGMECAAADFRIFWDNAYCVHHLNEDASDQDCLFDIAAACDEAGHPDRWVKFASTSKVTFPGSGLAALASSPANVAEIASRMNVQTIGHDKLNQLRHVRFLKDAEGIACHMRRHAAIVKPKFDLVARKLAEGLGELACGTWNDPKGGYFVSFDAPEGTAHRIVELARNAGVTMTAAGATFPYGKDPHDSNIRIAPTLPPLEELETALDVFVCCVKLATVEKALAD